MSPLLKATYRLAEQALARRVRKLHGDVLDASGRAQTLTPLLVPTITQADLVVALMDFVAGDGRELAWEGTRPPKLHSAHSSAGLALNTFARWRLQPGSLFIERESRFATLRFEEKLPVFDSALGAPNLDLALRRESQGIFAIESKLTEFLRPKTAQFAERYKAVVAGLASPGWLVRYEELRANTERFSFLDGAQLIKHYLGIKRAVFRDGGSAPLATLSYLYWEPADADLWPEFSAHRAEVAAFADGLNDQQVHFVAICYRDLWDSWHRADDGPLRRHVEALRARYDVRLDEFAS